MNQLKFFLSTGILSILFSLIGCSINSQTKVTSPLFDTKIEAEKAAKHINCIGAHKMGNKWMPCKIIPTSADAKNNDARNEHLYHH
tara:strand:- start:101 stop:358 length:258 start_codon:yes stop_codon:yes gene_type:complete